MLSEVDPVVPDVADGEVDVFSDDVFPEVELAVVSGVAADVLELAVWSVDVLELAVWSVVVALVVWSVVVALRP